MPREDLSEEERKSQILDAAQEEFAEHGFDEARMDDIARRSGLSKGGLYLYYKSKDALIAAMLRRLFTWEMRGVHALLKADGTAAERMHSLTRTFAADLERLSAVMPVMLEFYAVAARQRSVRQYLGDVLGDYRATLSALIRQGIEHGEFRAVNTDDVAVALAALYEGLILLWVIDPHAVQWQAQADFAVRLLLDGLRAQ